MINELRLGNWIKWSTMPIQIVNETIAYRTYLKSNENRVKPIEITHEVAKTIADNVSPEWAGDWIGIISLNDTGHRDCSYIELDFTEGSLRVGLFVIDEALSESNELKLPHIKYLHQIQNLYYSLTGKELQIKSLVTP